MVIMIYLVEKLKKVKLHKKHLLESLKKKLELQLQNNIVQDIILLNIQKEYIFIVDEYSGEPLEFEENKSMWINIDDLYKEDRLFPSIEVIKYLKDNMNVKVDCDSNHNIITIDEI